MMEELHTDSIDGGARLYIGQVTCQGEGVLQHNIHTRLCVSEKGWTDREISLLWLQLHFEPHTRARLPDDSHYRLLVMDGHGSHVTNEFLEYC
jgi:hypothetical protein